MLSSNRYRTTKKSAKSAAKYAGRTIVGLGRWAITDHTGTAKFLANMPAIGFIDAISVALVGIVSTVLGAVASVVLFTMLISFGIPLLLGL
jgi:hypothetical protein